MGSPPTRVLAVIAARDARRSRRDGLYRAVDAVPFATLLAGVVAFFVLLAAMVAPVL